MTMIKVEISAVVRVPDGLRTVDYTRALGNYLVDLLPNSKPGVIKRDWQCSHATIHTVVKIEDDEL